MNRAYTSRTFRADGGIGLRQITRRLTAGRPHCLLYLLICTLLLAPSLKAQAPPPDLADRSPEELMNIQVYSASKFAQRVSDAPAFVTVITADDIRNYGYRTLGDILESVPGFYVTYDRNYSYLGIRGFSRPADYSSRVLLMIDGHRINDNIYDMAPIGTEFPLDVDLIERVEIIRGPSSSLYGTSAFFGVIDVITRRGRDIAGAEVAFDAGSFGSYKERATYGNLVHGIEMLFSASHYDSDGHTLYFPELNTPDTNNGITSHTDDDASRDFYGSLSWREWTLRGTYSYREKGIPNGILGAVFGDPGTRSIDQAGFIDLSYDKSFRNWELLGKVAFDQYDFKGRYSCPAGVCAEEPTIDVEQATGKWVTSEFKISRALRFRQRVTAGVEFKDNLQQDQESAGHPERHGSRQSGVYGEDEIQLHPKVVLNLGARYDHNSIFGGTTSPRAAVILKPFKKTSIKLLYGLAFRAPTAFEYYYAALTSSTVTRDLRPETGRTYEIVWEQGLSKNLQFTTSVYATDVNSLITENLDVATAEVSFANATSAVSKGLEFQLVGKFPHSWETRAGFNAQKTTDELTDAVLTNSPRNLAKFNLSGPIWRKKLFVGVDSQYTAARSTLAGNRLGGYPTLNVTLLAKRLGRRVDASFSVYNLIDRRYADPGGDEDPEDSIMRDGRSFRLKLVYHYGGEK